MKKLFVLIIAIAASFSISQAQPFRQEIDNFKKKDSLQKPPADPILFTGSSSFRLWPDLPSYFPGYPVINRGFGGAILLDVIRYADEIIIPYKPKQVVIYCGENDLASSDTVTPAVVLDRFQQLFNHIRKKLPKTAIAFVAIKASPSRAHLYEKVPQANKLIKDFLAKKPKTSFIDVYTPMLVEGKPDAALFGGDMLHMNPKGYAIWQKAIQPYLVK